LWAVVGLGNPGKRYKNTKHNVGFALIERIAEEWGVRLKKRKHLFKSAQVQRGQKFVLLVKPWTYMNQSGLAVKEVVQRTGMTMDHLVVVYDDLDIPLGEIRIRREGGPGSHRGMISIIQEIGDARFPRVRIGIGPLPSHAEATDYVLTGFGSRDKPALNKGLAKAEEALMLILDGKIAEAMNHFNRKLMDVETEHQDKSEKNE
jgi:PTH1 family peptidyl-tRNA hydrolase